MLARADARREAAQPVDADCRADGEIGARDQIDVESAAARKLRDLTEKDFETFRRIAAGYVELARSYDTPADAEAAE